MRGGFSPLLARTSVIRRVVGPVAHDCIKVVVVRAGSAILLGDLDQKTVTVGDVIVLGANSLCGGEPEGQVVFTTVYADTDYVVDQVFWQYAGFLRDRFQAQSYAEQLFAESAQVLRVGSVAAAGLMPWLDELVDLSTTGRFVENFYRMQVLWFSVTDVIAPHIQMSVVPILAERSPLSPTQPRSRRFAPLRAEARRVAELLRDAPSEHWTLYELAHEVHLSPSQLSRVFADAYGKTPLAFLTMVRAERLARYLRETDLTVTDAMRRVGWHSRSHATDLFRQHVGLTPGSYRRQLQLEAQ